MNVCTCKVILFSMFLSLSVQADIDLKVSSYGSRQVVIDYNIKCHKKVSSLLLYRSYVDVSSLEYLDLYTYPITKMVLSGESNKAAIHDTLVASGCTYYYYVKAIMEDSSVCSSPVVSCIIPEEERMNIPVTGDLLIYVNKEFYFLELRYGDTVVKRYPVSLGSDPFSRKLHYDCSSTPEGKYSITILKPFSAYHKSIGISYPNSEDRARYKKAKDGGTLPFINGKIPDIGGSIMIHGGGIGNNWTWGCIAMRNEDIDELFDVFSIKVGRPVLISGKEVSKDQLF